MFSIIIPTLNNLSYLKLCIESIKKNSRYNHEIIPHVNIGTDGTLEYLKRNNIKFTYTKDNSGICKGMNIAAKESKKEYILYAHDDFYFCPDWDFILKNEIDKIGHNLFYLSGTMMHRGQIDFDCGNTFEDFDEKKFLSNYKDYNYYDFQGSTWAPHLIHKDIWNKVKGFSEEFYPGTGSDPDLNMKLWKLGVRIFKGINDFKVYHFASLTTRKNIEVVQNRGDNTFLKKWGFTIKFFKRFYMRTNEKYDGPLKQPLKNISFYLNLFICKIKLIYINFLKK